MNTKDTRCVSTFSVVARDEATGDFGVAVASKFLAVGAVVPYARAGVGAVATQSYANLRFGPQGLALLQAGAGPDEVLAAFRRTDPELRTRQFGLVGADGESLTFTGEACHDWAGGKSARNVAVQGNLLAGPEVVDRMLATYEEGADLPFPRRLLAALRAGDEAGGDRRGRQSASLLVVGHEKGYAKTSDVWIDLRADDHPQPVAELERLLGLHELLFTRPTDSRALEPEEVTWLQGVLAGRGLLRGEQSGMFDEATQAGLRDLYGELNLEERWVDGGRVDPQAWAHLRENLS